MLCNKNKNIDENVLFTKYIEQYRCTRQSILYYIINTVGGAITIRKLLTSYKLATSKIITNNDVLMF